MQYTDILYTIDIKYIDIMLCSIYSLIHNSNLSNIRLHIVCENFLDDDYNYIDNFMCNYPNIEYELYPMEEVKCSIPKWSDCHAANARLFYPKILKKYNKNIHNLLYIDSDTFIVNDLSNIEIYKDNLINACSDITSNKYRKQLKLNRYYNSGVLYINTDKWLDMEMDNKIRFFLKYNNTPLRFPDQDTLNIVMKNDISKLPLQYNVGTYPFIFNDLELKFLCGSPRMQESYEELIEARKNPIILHSYDLYWIKPWDKNNINPFSEMFDETIKKINPYFNKHELEGFKSKLANNPTLLKNMILVRNYTPDKLARLPKKLVLKNKGL
ncbi:MAG: hypothetical protein IJ565_06775 [Bacilli bacterium]|nr:hypothetical protein [Bacilli bacterium]